MSPGMSSTVSRVAPKVIERVQEVPTLEAIAHTTDTTYSAARFAPRDYEDLRAQAADAYDSGDLRKDFYPPKRKKEYRAGGKGFDWRDIRFTPEETVAWRHRAILRLVRIARLGAALGYLPEVSWENIYAFDGTTMVGCHFMKGAILALPSCVEWTDEEVTEKLKDGGERVIGYKMRVKRMLPSGNVQPTFVQCYLSEFAHLFEGENGKDVWLKYGTDMIYAACVRRAANHAFPDRVRGMGTKEEAAVMSRASMPTREAPLSTPGIDSLLEDVEGPTEPLPLAPPVAPAPVAETAQGASVAERPGLSPADLKALLTRVQGANDSTTAEEISELRAKVEAFNGVAPLGYPRLVEAWTANEFLGPYVVAS